MGMDVSGINPTTAEGEYFRANIWSWPGIHHLIAEAVALEPLGAEPLLTEEQLRAMCHNDGAPGVIGADKCAELAERIEKMLSVAEQLGAESIKLAKADDPGVCLAGAVMAALGGEKVEPAHFVTRIAHAREFVAFLRGCGEGFEVW